MKNLKRVLALVMVVALVFSLSVSALAFTDDAAITNNQAVNVLSELGVIKGYPDGSFRPTDNVTRAEMAKMITVILNKGVDDPSQFDSGVTDLTDISWNWGKSYITYCYLLNIIAGYGDGTFRPDNEVTVQEAAKMILVALGFDVTQEGLEGVNWAVNANARANQYDIYTGVTQGVNEAATRDTIAQMLYNMLKANTVHYDVNIYTGISTLQKDEKALSKYFDCELLNGMIIANEYASLWDGTPLIAGRTEVLLFDDDLIENGIFDEAQVKVDKYDIFTDWDTVTLKTTSGQDELGLWVSFIRNQTTGNIVGSLMLNSNDMVVVQGGDGDFKDAIKAAGLRLVDGKYSIFVNSQILTWESISSYSVTAGTRSLYVPDPSHPLYINEAKSYTIGSTDYAVYNAALGLTMDEVLGEYKDMKGMTFRAVDLNGNGYVDAVYVEAETLTRITKVETKGGAKEYTFAGLNLSLNSTGLVAEDGTYGNYTAQSVKAADIVTDDTLAVDDYVLVAQVNDTYYVSQVVFEDMTVSAKSTTAKTLTLKDTDGTSTTYDASNIPVVYAITSDTDVHTNVTNISAKGLVDNTVAGNKYTFGFDSAGNVVMAKAVSEKTKYAMMNGMTTTYGTSYTAQLYLEDGSTITGGVGDFNGFLSSGPSAYIAGQSAAASSNPQLVSYKEDGSDLNLINEADDAETSGYNTFTGGTSLYLDVASTGATTSTTTTYRVTSDTVFFYRIKGTDGKVNYYAYTDYTKAPTFTASTVDVYVAKNADNASRADAVLVVADKYYDTITDATSQNYIYISKVTSTDYTNKQATVSGILIDKNFKVTEVTGMVFDKALEDASTAGQLYTYSTTGTEDVYKLNPSQTLHTLTTRNDTYIEWGTGSDEFATYSSSITNTYRYTGQGGDRYEKLTGNFGKNLVKGEQVYVVKDESNVAVFVLKVGNVVPYVTGTTSATSTVSSNDYFAYNNSGTYYQTTFNATSYAPASGPLTALSTTAYTDSDGVISSNEPATATGLSVANFGYVTIALEKTVVTDTYSDATTVETVSYRYVATSVAGAQTFSTGILLDVAVAATSTADGEYTISSGTIAVGNGSTTDSYIPVGSAIFVSITGNAVSVGAYTATGTPTADDTYEDGYFYYAGVATGYDIGIIVY